MCSSLLEVGEHKKKFYLTYTSSDGTPHLLGVDFDICSKPP